ncbi:MAG: hypothetical protein AB2L07_15685 [Thermoanaerobaculaceae bacterium]
MKVLTPAEVHARKVAELGLDPTAVDLVTKEALAAALRRVACFLCPCSARTLLRAVLESLEGLADDVDVLAAQIESSLDALISYGDLIESSENGEATGSLVLFLAPPSFVLRDSGMALLLGGQPDQHLVLPASLADRIEYRNHVRYLRPKDPSENLRQELDDLGLLELSLESWMRAPERLSPENYKQRMDALLNEAGRSGDIPGLSVLDPSQPVKYYRGRWTRPERLSGRFVARREQAYGADLWCYVELDSGVPNRLLDLPLAGSLYRGCDEAWRLQMAIDTIHGNNQLFRIQSGPGDSGLLQVFSPVPIWARRRWDAVGELVAAAGCLFAYRFVGTEIAEEARFAVDDLWLRDTDAGSH